MKTKQKGFTLIELLVVIAIIGILSSVVLTSLNSARKKGQDGKVKSQVTQIAAAAAIYYDSAGGSYGAVAGPECTTAGSMWTDTSSSMSTYAGSAVAGTWPGSIACIVTQLVKRMLLQHNWLLIHLQVSVLTQQVSQKRLPGQLQEYHHLQTKFVHSL
jgi:prepilin-type N-terminal cleavage/methylation domain-containing protein